MSFNTTLEELIESRELKELCAAIVAQSSAPKPWVSVRECQVRQDELGGHSRPLSTSVLGWRIGGTTHKCEGWFLEWACEMIAALASLKKEHLLEVSPEEVRLFRNNRGEVGWEAVRERQQGASKGWISFGRKLKWEKKTLVEAGQIRPQSEMVEMAQKAIHHFKV